VFDISRPVARVGSFVLLMHRRRVKLSAWTRRFTEWVGHGSALVGKAKDVEHHGVIATYKLHDRALGNRRARRRFEHAPPVLDEVQQRVLRELGREDYALVPFAELVPDEALRKRVEEEGAAFVAATVERLASAGADPRDDYKDYLVRRQARGAELALDSPWLTCCLSERLLDVANTYLGMWSKLEYVDFWYSVPVQSSAKRIQSQRWHRDFDDRHLLKAFLYLVDVDAETGPLEFVAGSARGGTAAAFWPWHPASPTYPPEEEFDRSVPTDAIRTFTAPAGTLILCNTSGFHRGGFATANPRVLATATYCSPASLASLTEWNYTLSPEDEASLSGSHLFAVPHSRRGVLPRARATAGAAARNGRARVVRAALAVLVILVAVLVLLPEALGDRPYDVF
jgi:ectoine hydroxylase-related dioxygenase (phytanoyl-CoA dioxygenase family)